MGYMRMMMIIVLFQKNKKQFNARNIKGENTGQNTKMEYTPPITALSEMTEKIVRIRKYHHQQPPQTADLVAMATCYCS
jgi:hypothetical protein